MKKWNKDKNTIINYLDKYEINLKMELKDNCSIKRKTGQKIYQNNNLNIPHHINLAFQKANNNINLNFKIGMNYPIKEEQNEEKINQPEQIDNDSNKLKESEESKESKE